MRDAIADIALLIPTLTDENQAAQIYWAAYRNLVPITNPEERQKIMRFMACGACLECASVIAARAYPELLWTARSVRNGEPKGHSASVWQGKVAVAHGASCRHEGDALLLAMIRHAINVRASGARKVSA